MCVYFEVLFNLCLWYLGFRLQRDRCYMVLHLEDSIGCKGISMYSSTCYVVSSWLFRFLLNGKLMSHSMGSLII